MSTRLINMRDKVTTIENSHMGGFRGEVIFGRGRKTIPYIDPFGHQNYRSEFDEVYSVDGNIVPIGGYQFAFNKLFNIGLDQDTTLRVGDLNDEAPQMKIGVPRSEYNSIHYNAECSLTEAGVIVNPGVNIPATNCIFGFMIGDGGASEDNVIAIAPNYKNRTLYHAIPFRMNNDGTLIPDGKYYGRATSFAGSTGQDPIISSYVKLFDDPAPHIVHVWATDNPNEKAIVDDTVFASTSSVPIESYVEMNLSVSADDGRGYCASTGASPKVNEFALVTGWFNSIYGDYESIRMFTHFTRPSIAMAEGDAIEAIYRLYAR